jgi:hypothetical protein
MIPWIQNQLAKLIPAGYSWQVAIKKGSILAGKFALSLLLGSKAGPLVTAHTTPDQLSTVQAGVTVASGVVLELVHDWLKLHFPNSPYL